MKISLTLIGLLCSLIMNGQVSFEELTTSDFPGVRNSSVAFADVDGDNDQDILITGNADPNAPTTSLYSNDGEGNYTLVANTAFEAVSSSSVAFADIDADNDQDVLITGYTAGSTECVAQLYTNDGSGSFTLTSSPFIGVCNGSIAFADIDGDNDQDVLITGGNSESYGVSNLYTNDGYGNYTLASNTPFAPVKYSSIGFSDIDGDDDLDVLLTGLDYNSQAIAKLYTNDGNGNYSLTSDTQIEGIQQGCTAFADVDGDNDPDVLITGKDNANERIAQLYTNDGSGNYSLSTNTPFTGVLSGTISFIDVDGDNDQDVLITGGVTSCELIANLYCNDGNGEYTIVSDIPFHEVYVSSVALGDIDGDNDKDVLITGVHNDGWSHLGAYFIPVSEYTCPLSTGTDYQTACNSFTWIDGNTYTTSNNTATHNLAGASEGGCDSIVTLNLTVIGTLDISTSINGMTITAQNNSATYRWLDCDNNFAIIPGETAQSFTATESGNYALELTQNGCVDISDCIAITTVGVTENSFGSEFKIYPNPTEGDLIIDFGNSYRAATIVITDLSGRLVKSASYSGVKTTQMNLDIPTGIYFLTAQVGDKRAVTRLVKH